MTKPSENFIVKNGRKLYLFQCSECSTWFYRRRDYIKDPDNCHCSLKCAHAYRKTSITTTCDYCGKEITRKPSLLKKYKYHYCSRNCSAAANNKRHRSGKNHPNYTNGSKSYRKRALREYGHKCQNPDCLLTKELGELPVEMLDVDHIDNDRSNNAIENLQVLCVWCHAIKTRGVDGI